MLSFIEIKEIIKKWKQLYDLILENPYDIRNPYPINVREVIQKCRNLSKFLESNIEILRQWCVDYLAENRREVWIRFWLNNGTKEISEQINGLSNNFNDIYDIIHPDFCKEWTEYILNKVPISKDYDESFKTACQIVKNYHQRRNVEFCDDPEILEIHLKKECNGDGWSCYNCDDLEHTWRNKLKKDIRNVRNIFINLNSQESFIQEVLSSSKFVIPDDWSPPKLYSVISKDHRKYIAIYTKEEYEEAIIEQRSWYKKEGLTPYKCAENLLFSGIYSSRNMGWYIDSIYGNTDTPFQVFLSLWSFLDILPENIKADLQRCSEIEEMY